MKGALVELKQAAAPNVVVFQFNPETLQHRFGHEEPVPGANPLATGGAPGERFSFTLAMDVSDLMMDGNEAVRLDAAMNGLYSRLAALEMLMFPTLNLMNVGADDRSVPASVLPTVLFVWGAGRIVPVRITSLAITEKLFDEQLKPTHAEAVLELRVVTPAEIDAMADPFKTFAKAAYNYTQGKRVALAIANLANSSGVIELPPLPGL